MSITPDPMMSFPRLAVRRAGLGMLLVVAAGLVACAAPSGSSSSSASSRTAATREASTPASSAMVRTSVTESGVSNALLASGDEVVRYHQIVTTLSDPFFEGRAPGTNGVLVAADYLEWNFERAGLEPLFTDANGEPSYRQPFEVTGPLEVVRSGASWTVRGAKAMLKEGADFNVAGFSGNGEASGELVFVGYSIEEGQDGYESYGDADDLTGKIAMILRFEPMMEDGTSKWAENGWSSASALAGKIQAAKERGAAGIILVNPPEADDPRAQELGTARGTAFSAGLEDTPAVLMSQDAADRMLRAATGRSLIDWRKKADDVGGVTVVPQAVVSIEGGVERPRLTTDNVAGVLRGKGALAEEYIVVGGHYDHVGYGYFGSRGGFVGEIHEGADDNASGTAGVIMQAERLKRMYDELPRGTDARSIVFMGFGAEESGLNGSRYFVDNMPFAESQVQAMINMDMIGRLRDEQMLEIGGVETAAGFKDMLMPVFDDSGIPIKTSGGGSGPSDHASFNAKGIPVLFFHTGLHDDYHRPGDESQKINFEGGVAVANLAGDTAKMLALKPEKLEFRETGTRNQMGSVARARVRLGIAPGNYSDTDPGVVVGNVTPGTSAADAGLLKGDRIIKWGGEELVDVGQMMQFLGKHNPGDVVELVVVRDGKEVPIKVTMKPAQNTRQ
jgi:hypothetical protein